MIYRKYIKRLIDIFLPIIGLVLLFPFILLVLILVKINLGSPILFKQERIGKGKKPFMLYKFRSMTEERDEKGVYLPDSERLTKFGRFLRSSSIDELPSLLNILFGEMSIIGPRPLPVRYLNRYTDEQLRRQEVLPGLSCLDSVNGRNLLTWDEKFQMDIFYVEHISFRLDVKILLLTIVAVFNRKGATAIDGDVRSEFWGTKEAATLDEETDYIKM